METFGLNIANAIALVIPCHGVFLSAFFIIRSELKPGSNFLLGLMLLALSLLSLYELLSPLFAVFSSLCFPYYFYELLISPFLFLYATVLIHPGSKNRIGIHLLNISFMMPLTVLCFENFLIRKVLEIVYSMINGIYLFATLYQLGNFIKKHPLDLRQLRYSRYSWIFNLCFILLTALITSIIMNALSPKKMIYLSQLPKGFVIYYTYYKILIHSEMNLKQLSHC
jgi:hypothetical protein